MTTISARDFNRDVSAAKRAAKEGPVVVTDRGRAAYVLLSAQEYARLTDGRGVVEWLQADDDIEFDPAPVGSLPRAAQL